MDREIFKEFTQKSFEIVKNNTKHPMQLFRDEMIHFNIVMYSFFNCFFNNSDLDIMSTFAELNYIFNRILLSSNARESFDSFLENYVNHYIEVCKAFEEEPSLQGLKPEARTHSICMECMRTIASSCESDKPLRIVDMFVLCIIMAEQIGLDFEKLIELTQFAADEIAKLIEAQQKKVEESGEAEKNPTTDNN